MLVKDVSKMKIYDEDFTVGLATGYLINEIAENKNVSKKMARQLPANALLYHAVKVDIFDRIDYFLKNDAG